MDRCIVLNGDYTFLNTVSWRRAVTLVMAGKTEVIKYADKVIRLANGTTLKIPVLIKLMKIIRTIYRNKVPFSKRNVMVRDNYKCCYCGCCDELTIDHVIPSSRGGKTEFDNCITCCMKCNAKKGDRTPTEARMYLQKRPYAPTISEFFRIKMRQLGLEQFINDIMGV
jgi:5-methylcytosine-specific restriction endonuclease McrA